MKNIVNLSEATAIGLHAMTFIVKQEKPVSATHIAEALGVSAHHLSKVLRHLVVADLLSSQKGPSGGFYLTEEQAETSFMQILEATDGKPKMAECLFGRKPCEKGKCILGSLLCQLNTEFIQYFKNTKIKSFKGE